MANSEPISQEPRRVLTRLPRSLLLSVVIGAACAGMVALSAATWRLLESRNAAGIDLVFVSEYQIPADYPTEIFTAGKGGRNPHIQYPREEYIEWFQCGFRYCHQRFVWPDDPWCNGGPVDPYDDACGPSLKQYGAYARRADEDGFKACFRQLRHLSDRFGVPRVRRALRWKLSSWDEILRYHLRQNSDGVRAILGVLFGSAGILAVVKLANRRGKRRRLEGIM